MSHLENAFTPPPLNRAGTIKLIAVISSCILAVGVCSIFAASHKNSEPAVAAPAVSLVGGNVYEAVPPQEICLDSPKIFYEKPYEFETNNPYITDERNMWAHSVAKTDASGKTVYEKYYFEKCIAYSGPTTQTPQTLSGSFSLTWRDCGVDAGGDRIDLKLVFTNIRHMYKLYDNTDISAAQPTDQFPLIDIANNDGLHAWAQRNNNMSYDIEFFAYKTGTENVAEGIFWSGINGLTEPNSYLPSGIAAFTDEFSEHIELIDKYVPTVYKPDISEIRTSVDNTCFYPPYPRSTSNERYATGVVIGLQPDGGKMRWASSVTGGGQLFLPFETKTIVSTHSEGGDVFASVGYTAPDGKISCGWKTNREVSVKADAGYKISSVKVDGEEVFTGEDLLMFFYKFSPVIANHKIEAFFEPFPVHIDWVDTLTGNLVASYDTYGGAASPVPALPQHAGHCFSHLSGDDWSCVMENSIVYINYAPYLYDFPQTTSSRYNGFTFAYRESDGSVSQ